MEKEFKLPELTGNERDVRYAEEIRNEGIWTMTDKRMKYDYEEYDAMTYAINDILLHTEADWWIDHRKEIGQLFIRVSGEKLLGISRAKKNLKNARSDIRELLEKALDELFLKMQKKLNIPCGDIAPEHVIRLEIVEEVLVGIIVEVLGTQMDIDISNDTNASAGEYGDVERYRHEISEYLRELGYGISEERVNALLDSGIAKHLIEDKEPDYDMLSGIVIGMLDSMP